MNTIWLLRMARWARRPPSRKQLIFIGAIFVLCFTLFTIEYFIGFPDWMTMDPKLRRMRP